MNTILQYSQIYYYFFIFPTTTLISS